MVCGIMLMGGQENVADAANMILMGLLFFSLYANWALGEGLKEASHGIVLGLVLTCRFVIRLQVSLLANLILILLISPLFSQFAIPIPLLYSDPSKERDRGGISRE